MLHSGNSAATSNQTKSAENDWLGLDDPTQWEAFFWGPQSAPPAAQPDPSMAPNTRGL